MASTGTSENIPQFETAAGTEPAETILIVDDEEPVRRTFQEWLTGAGLDGTILIAADAEEALHLANRHTIDLAILDWALGAGDDSTAPANPFQHLDAFIYLERSISEKGLYPKGIRLHPRA